MPAMKQDITAVYCMKMPARLDMNAISCNLNVFHEARTLLNCLKKLIHHVAASGPGYRGVMSTGPINDGASESE